MQPSPQRKVVNVDRGLFLIRYVSADDGGAPPHVQLSAAPGSREDLRFLLHPDECESVLRHPGSTLVLRADMPGRIAMDIVPAHQHGSVAAKIQFEPLGQAPEAAANPRDVTTSPRHLPLEIMGHVASRGDVGVDDGAWLAGPAAPARIEGFAIRRPDRHPGVDLRYRIKTAQARGAYGPWAEAGAFVGSRGRALPIVGLEIEIAGPAASRYGCAVDLLFLGSSIAQLAGQRIEGEGPTGREPLVGLRVSLADVGEARHGPAVSPSRAAIEGVKIYRSDALGQRRP